MLNELKITEKQKKLLQEIVKSHAYFPELVLDDLDFKNNFYVPKDPVIVDMIERGIINKQGKTLTLPRLIAKKYWNDILSIIPVDEKAYPVTQKFLETKTTEELIKVYHTLTSLDGTKLNRDNLITEILSQFNFNKGENKMTMKEKKQAVKDAAPKKKVEVEDDGLFTPKQIAKDNGINPTALRKAIRSLYGKSKDGNWRLTQDQVDEVLDKYEAMRKQAAENKAKNMERLAAARKAKLEAEAKPAKATKKVSKKSEE